MKRVAVRLGVKPSKYPKVKPDTIRKTFVLCDSACPTTILAFFALVACEVVSDDCPYLWLRNTQLERRVQNSPDW